MLNMGANARSLVRETVSRLPRTDSTKPAKIIHVHRHCAAKPEKTRLQAHLDKRDIRVHSLSLPFLNIILRHSRDCIAINRRVMRQKK